MAPQSKPHPRAAASSQARPRASARAKRSLAIRIPLGFGKGLGVLLLFVVALVGSVLLHLDHPLTRRVAVSRVNDLLAGLFLGKIEITKLDHVRLVGLSGASATITDPDGVQVLSAENVSARVNVSALLHGLHDGIHLELVDLHVERTRALLAQNPKGELRIANVFVPREPSPPSTEPSTFHLAIRDALLDDVHVDNELGLKAGADLRHVGVAVAVDPDRTSITVDHAGIRTQGIPGAGGPPADLDGFLAATVALPAADGKLVGLHAAIQGTAGNVPLEVVADLDGMRLVADVHAFDPTGERVKALVPNLPRAVPVDVHVTAYGPVAKDAETDPVPELHAVVHAAAASARVTTFATLTLHDGTGGVKDPAVAAVVRAEHVDLSEILPDGPKSHLGTEIHAHASLGTPLKGDFTVGVLAGDVAGQLVPPTDLAGTFEDTDVKVKGTVHEPGAPITLDASLEKAELLKFSVHTAPIDLATQRRVPRGVATGTASVHAEGQLHLSNMALTAHARVNGTKLASNGASAEDLHVDIDATGTAQNPQLAVQAEGTGVTAPNGMHLNKMVARTKVVIAPTLALRDVDVALDNDHSLVKIQARQIGLAGGVSVDGIHVEGFGQPIEGDFAMHGRRLVVKLRGTDVDLASVGHFLATHAKVIAPTAPTKPGAKPKAPAPPPVADTMQPGVAKAPHAPAKTGVPYPNALPVTGRVTLDVDLVAEGNRIDGHADVDAHELKGFGVEHAKAGLMGRFEGATSTLRVTASAAPFGDAKITVDQLAPGGEVLSPASWKRATFRVSGGGSGNLGTVLDLKPDLPLSELSGKVAFEVEGQRPDPAKLPDVKLHVATDKLQVAAGADLASRNVDLDLVLALLEGHLDLAFVAKDPKGALLDLAVDTKLPAAIPDDLALLADHPLSVQVHVPRRAIADLPPALGLGDMPGRVQFALTASGTLRDPRFALDFDARNVSPAGASTTSAERRMMARARAARAGIPAGQRAKATANGPLVDALVRASYDGERARASVVAGSGGRNLLDAQVSLRAKVHDIFSKGAGDPAKASFWNRDWDASARVAADELPLEWIPVLGDSGLRGQLGGELVLDDYHRDAKLKGAFRIANLRTGRIVYKAARIELEANDNRTSAKVFVDQDGGKLQLVAGAGTDWGNRPFPKPKDDQPLHVALDAQHFQVAAIQPFVANYLQQLDGYLDADLDVDLQPREKKFTTKGQIAFKDGTIQTPYIADEFHDVAFRITMSPDGTAKLEHFIAHPVEGEIQGSAAAHFDGIDFKGAEASFEIPKRKSIELAVAGLSLNNVYGSTKIVAKMQPSKLTGADGKLLQGMVIDVSVPAFNAELPGIPSGDLQPLAKPEGVAIGMIRGGRFVALPLDGSDLVPVEPEEHKARTSAPMVVTIDLGNIDFAVANLAKVTVGGKPRITLDDTTQIDGQIVVKSGTLDVQGKEFTVDNGTVTFDPAGDPGNPQVSARASWVAQDRTKVIASFVGPVKTGRVELRSEPALPKNEVLALLLFGNTRGMGGGPNNGVSGAQTAGVAVAGGAATEGLTQAVSGLTGLKAQARIDSSTNNPRPEIEVQVAKNVSIGFQTVLGTPPFSNPDRFYGKFAWAFAANWSLVATIGEKYSSLLDAVWNYRY